MFLKAAYLYSNGHNNIHIFSWIEKHPVTVGVLTIVITSWFWWRNFLKQKRAEAFLGFYSQIMLQLKNLRLWLDEKNLLNVDTPEAGNVYALMYNDTVLINNSKIKHSPSDQEVTELTVLVSQLEETLLKSENNVYPKSANKNKKLWYDSQAILFSFCDFIKQKSMHHCINVPQYTSGDNKDQYKHIVKCNELRMAMMHIQDYIEKSYY